MYNVSQLFGLAVFSLVNLYQSLSYFNLFLDI